MNLPAWPVNRNVKKDRAREAGSRAFGRRGAGDARIETEGHGHNGIAGLRLVGLSRALTCQDGTNVGLSDRDLAVDVERHLVFLEVGDVAEREVPRLPRGAGASP